MYTITYVVAIIIVKISSFASLTCSHNIYIKKNLNNAITKI